MLVSLILAAALATPVTAPADVSMASAQLSMTYLALQQKLHT
jgi:hypothetical protein